MITLKRYSHLLEERITEAADRLATGVDLPDVELFCLGQAVADQLLNHGDRLIACRVPRDVISMDRLLDDEAGDCGHPL